MNKKEKNQPVENFTLSKDQFLQRTIDNRAYLSRWLSGLLFVFSSFFLVIGFFYTSLALDTNYYIAQGATTLAVLSYLYCFLKAKRGINLKLINRIGTLLVAGFLISITITAISTKMNASFAATFILIPVIAGFVGLSVRWVTIYTWVAGSLLGALFGILRIANNPKGGNLIPEYVGWLGLFSLICSAIILFIDRAGKSNQQLERQTEKLAELLERLNATTDFGASLSQGLSGVTTELNQASQNQTSSTFELVSALNQVTTSIEELGETANHISNNASHAAEASQKALESANLVKEVNSLTEENVHQGIEAVGLTMASVGQVRNRIELLGQRLLSLTEQTRRVGSIIDIIDEIADETHLLALNASIEAAGNIVQATQATTSNGKVSLRGERFGVIAQEIKNLSERSREATEEVRQAITEMQGAVAGAVLVAEEGKKETAAAASRSEIAGAVINKLNSVLVAGTGQAEEILKLVTTVQEQCYEISLATRQQRSANQQILSTMRNVAAISQQNAGSVVELSKMVTEVNAQIDRLNDVLSRPQTPLTTA